MHQVARQREFSSEDCSVPESATLVEIIQRAALTVVHSFKQDAIAALYNPKKELEVTTDVIIDEAVEMC